VRVVVASDKFKGSLTAADVASALTAGIRRTAPTVEVVPLPVADGGDGTLEAAASAGFERCPVTVTGPTGSPVATAYARRGGTAVVELADASGLARLPDGPAPREASTIGTGELIRSAVDAGCRDVVLGLGGSSSTDGGAGLLVGLGARILDGRGHPVPPGGGGLGAAVELDLAAVHRLLEGVTITIASDVDSPLTGGSGAAVVYGPQKGADATDVQGLDQALVEWADLVTATVGTDLRDHPGAGAAGGAGFGALVLGATLRSGIDTVLDLVGFDAVASGADLVVTGEGSLDAQSLLGKAPMGVARAAARLGVPVVAVCGRSELAEPELRAAGFARTWALLDVEPDADQCLVRAADLLEDVGQDLGRSLPELTRPDRVR